MILDNNNYNKDIKVGILGAGGWGCALACVLADNQIPVTIWAFEQETVADINNNHRNSVYLPNAELSPSIKATNSFDDLNDCDIIIISTPTQHIRSIVAQCKDLIKSKKIINVSKGIEIGTMYRISEILEEVCEMDINNYAVLTGPSHAEEVARKKVATVVTASQDLSFAQEIQTLFSNKYFRVYTSSDIIGCEIGGALKNVIAVATGIVDGGKYGDNAKAAIFTRGLVEMSRLAMAMGANYNTLFGLSGIGDLFVTCASTLSRNWQVGNKIGQNIPLEEIMGKTKMVAEGVHSTRSAYQLSQKYNIDMPIITQMFHVLFEGRSPDVAVGELMGRRHKSEWI